LLSSKDDDAIVKLSDFGFAKETRKGLSSVVYSLDCAPPEILKRERHPELYQNYDISCDIWSLGVIMYLLCYGKLPFSTSNVVDKKNCIKKRILSGEFCNDSKNLSKDARLLIDGMIEV
jgi:serine/threonine protein kinase